MLKAQEEPRGDHRREISGTEVPNPSLATISPFLFFTTNSHHRQPFANTLSDHPRTTICHPHHQKRTTIENTAVTVRRTTKVRTCFNLGSYNYLGFASSDAYCTPRVIQSLKKYHASTCSARVDGGTTALHSELEEVVADFVRKPAAFVTGMGFVTNSAIIPVLIGKAYVYLDEAHSIGAVGKTGRGVCELLGVDTDDVDIMMGTFTKSFGSCGGYIAGSKELIRYLKYTCPAHLYATSISPPAAQQIISSIKVILGEDGSSRGAQKLVQIRENINFFRSELQKMGFEVLGDNDSPIMPIMLFNPAKIPAFSRECLKRNVAVVAVSFPVTPLLLARARVCISAAHTREDMMQALKQCSSISQSRDLIHDICGYQHPIHSLPAPLSLAIDQITVNVTYSGATITVVTRLPGFSGLLASDLPLSSYTAKDERLEEKGCDGKERDGGGNGIVIAVMVEGGSRTSRWLLRRLWFHATIVISMCGIHLCNTSFLSPSGTSSPTRAIRLGGCNNKRFLVLLQHYQDNAS
ncbi:hypothetical protein SSX86_008790 [Deinandra increscens subsp. villosa]|uniref:serine C-palmitoyltransferase n=1 Tax=Deinandra increscens subsp. villosa TaxID=3103831 RepID=A0AAP0DBZ8_9ASTR